MAHDVLPALTGEASASTGSAYPIIVSHLRKEFPTGSSLVQSFSAHVCCSRRAGSGKSKASKAATGPLSINSDETSAEATRGLLADHALDGSVGGALVPVDVRTQHVASGSPAKHYHELEQEVMAAAPRPAKVAVSDLTFAVRSEQVFGLLGENGSGKTTTVSMLTGLFPPTAGDAYMDGHHVVHASDQARRSIGVCMQQDILWLNLTVAEHLRFYARVKGVPPSDLEAHVTDMMTSVGLATFKDRYAGDLSGGMKRRLSLACSFVGNSRIWLGDEVTTGLDPATKRRIWRIINAARRGRAMLLISHDMAEVETLASRIGIMTFGRMRCIGSQQRLKSLYGGGQILHINYAIGQGANGSTSTSAGDAIIDRIQELLPGSRVDSHMPGTIAMVVPDELHTTPTGSAAAISRSSIAHVFDVMQAHSHQLGILDWGVGQVNMDTVFQRIVRHYRGARKTGARASADASGSASGSDSD